MNYNNCQSVFMGLSELPIDGIALFRTDSYDCHVATFVDPVDGPWKYLIRLDPADESLDVGGALDLLFSPEPLPEPPKSVFVRSTRLFDSDPFTSSISVDSWLANAVEFGQEHLGAAQQLLEDDESWADIVWQSKHAE